MRTALHLLFSTLNKPRETAKWCSIPLMAYQPVFTYYDQYLVTVQNTIQNVVVTVRAMLIVSLLLTPNPLCCLWVTFSIASAIIGLAGFVTFWNISLDSISMISLVICTGFSDFSARITYVSVTSGSHEPVKGQSSVPARLLDIAVSTILGVVVLAAAKVYIFRTFFKILCGALHSLVFILVLTFFRNFGRSPRNTKSKKLELKFRNHKDCL
ncbi:LOW QUALITY PROTEIN: patched domain-containing protein 3-like [Phalacrocorax aristotelis]|uniref:LOW QUALITY PROTEIN: patched domain-containing protein 3-like n=1 Tax=Phalacrocorax aristotelis TaxID=126867 RepID=UPI003F4C4A4A